MSTLSPNSRPGCNRSNKLARMRAVGYWGLVAAGEPFRLLFPLGAAIGIFGVLLWPLYVWKVIDIYPGQLHARIMIEGFLACFVIGFLGTALPRLLGVPRMTIWETLGFASGLLGITFLHYTEQSFLGDQVFFFTLTVLVIGLLVRWIFRTDTPPPAFVLVGMGILLALVGSATLVISSISLANASEWSQPIGKLFLYQGFLLLPAMGIGAFLLPRFFGLPNRQSFPESLSLPDGWQPRALFAFCCGVAVVVSFVMEAMGELALGCGLRAAAFLVYLGKEVPFYKSGWGGGSLATGLRIALVSIPLGLILVALYPADRFSFLHLVFISGFSVLVFTVATRVVLGHSGQANRFQAKLWSIRVLLALLVLAMLTRVSADWMPKIQMSHYGFAALTWIAGVFVWAFFILPSVRKADA